jgi:hypothetical protein
MLLKKKKDKKNFEKQDLHKLGLEIEAKRLELTISHKIGLQTIE